MNVRDVKTGTFAAADAWKCKHCRSRNPPGTLFVILILDEKPWWGCQECAEKPLDLGVRQS